MLTDDQRAKFVRLTQQVMAAKFEFLAAKMLASSADDPEFRFAERRYSGAVESLLRFHHKLVANGIRASVDEQVEVLKQVASNLNMDYNGPHFKRYREEIAAARQREASSIIEPSYN